MDVPSGAVGTYSIGFGRTFWSSEPEGRNTGTILDYLADEAALDEEGLVEAIEPPHHPFAVGVQWHPERAGHDVLYSGLVEAARG